MTPPTDPGSLLVAGLAGTHFDDTARRRFHEDRISGLILFQRNAPEHASPDEVRRSLSSLLADARACAAEAGLPAPLLFVDHEGGRVHRYPGALTRFPPPGELAPLGFEVVTAVARQQARELRAVGFNTILGPVLDLCPAEGTASHIATRSYGPDPQRTAELGVAAIEAFATEGLLCVPKHFPGYGAAPIDPHLDLPTRTDSRAQLLEHDLAPFARAIAANAPAIMTAHIVATGVDPELPCTLSPTWLRLLREELKFTGCVVSDDLCMGAVCERYGLANLSVRSVVAGLDLLLVCHPEADTLTEIRAALTAEANANATFAARLTDAQQRVEAARAVATATKSELPATLFTEGEALLAALRT